MNKTELEDLDQRGITAWDQHDTEGFVSLLAEDFLWLDDTTPEPMRTRDDARRYTDAWYTAFPDLRVRETNRVIGDDGFAVELEFRGTNTGPLTLGGMNLPATGKAIVGRGAYFAKARDGRITEFHTHPDAAGMLSQLGLMQS
jgi:steroid delta-isomerase-like uncharacterized protein